MNVSVIEHGADNVTILLKWIPEDGVIYSASAVTSEPNAAIITMLSKRRYYQIGSARFILPYNIHHNVSITASTCGNIKRRAVTTVELYYGELKFLCHYNI